MNNPCLSCRRSNFRACYRCKNGVVEIDDRDVDYLREDREEQESHAAEYQEANQHRLGMLDGMGKMWWGNGRMR